MPEQVRVADAPSPHRFQYEYRNQYTGGKWARGTFDTDPADWYAAVEEVQKIALAWIMGTDLRLAETDSEGKEKFSEIAAKGNLAAPLADR